MNMLAKLSTLANKASCRVKSYGEQYNASALFFLVFYTANPLKWQLSGAHNVIPVLVLRIVALLLLIILIIKPLWPKKMLPYFPLFWLFILFYNLPFRTTFTIFNSSYTNSYAAYGVLGFVVLGVLVDNFLYILLSITGILIGTIVYLITGGLNAPIISSSIIFQSSYMILSISFIKLVFFRNHSLRLESKISSYKTLAGAIAHEISTPISTINIICSKLNSGLNSENLIIFNKIHEINIKTLDIINAILLQLKLIESNKKISCKLLNLKEIVINARNSMIFSDLDREIIYINIDDKKYVKANKRIFTQIFINLIKNSLRATKEVENPIIIISSEDIDKETFITVKDNGIGIDIKQKKKLFEPFYSLSSNGVGIGLAFCKLALQNMNCSITCESEINSYTSFIIKTKKYEA